MLATATETWKSLKVNLVYKVDVPVVFYVAVAGADIGSLKYHF